MKKLIALLVALSSMVAAVPAPAAVIYGFGGTFAGKLTTNLSTTPRVHNFSDVDLAFIGLGDDSPATLDTHLTALLHADVFSYSLATLLVTDGIDFEYLDGFSFLVAPTENLIGFANAQGLLFSVSLPASYDGSSSYAPSGFSDILASQAITFGNVKLKLNHVTDSTGGFFFAVAVPESATWAMFILGFGAVGAGMRRRRSILVGHI